MGLHDFGGILFCLQDWSETNRRDLMNLFGLRRNDNRQNPLQFTDNLSRTLTLGNGALARSVLSECCARLFYVIAYLKLGTNMDL